MKPRNLISILSVIAMVMILSGFAHAALTPQTVTITLGPATVGVSSQTATLNVRVDNPGEIAGAAFTVKYNTAELTLTNVTSTFFDTFANQLANAPIPYTSVEVGGEVYDQPLIQGDGIDDAGTTSVMVAAARGQAGETQTTLFTLTFNVLPDPKNAGDTYDVTIIPSVINNTDAGYDANGEAIPMLVAADTDMNAPLTEAFSAIPVTSESITGTIMVVGEAVAEGGGAAPAAGDDGGSGCFISTLQ
ncbi:hypothetical protein ACFLZM_06755 [Thermodesulfobacteriota bacterium]